MARMEVDVKMSRVKETVLRCLAWTKAIADVMQPVLMCVFIWVLIRMVLKLN